jgi:hypothetical protein
MLVIGSSVCFEKINNAVQAVPFFSLFLAPAPFAGMVFCLLASSMQPRMCSSVSLLLAFNYRAGSEVPTSSVWSVCQPWFYLRLLAQGQAL